MVQVIHSLKAGDEITVSYTNYDTFHKRQSSLKDRFGFDCVCDLCSLPLADRILSDTRRIYIVQLEDQIWAPGCAATRPEEALLCLRKVTELLFGEYKGSADPQEAGVYEDPVKIPLWFGDRARASTFAERAYKANFICLGEDHEQTREMKQLMQDPNSQETFSIAKRGKAGNSAAPTGLDERDFEKWLWRLD